MDFEKYKPHYRLYSTETVGVVIGDYVVFYNIDSKALVMVNTNHKLYPKINTVEATKIKMNQSIHNTNYRLMKCQNENTGLSYFVVYPAPEIRELNLFGVSGRTNVLSANFISNNLVLA